MVRLPIHLSRLAVVACAAALAAMALSSCRTGRDDSSAPALAPELKRTELEARCAQSEKEAAAREKDFNEKARTLRDEVTRKENEMGEMRRLLKVKGVQHRLV